MGWEVISVVANASSSECRGEGREGTRGRGDESFHLGAIVDAPGKRAGRKLRVPL